MRYAQSSTELNYDPVSSLTQTVCPGAPRPPRGPRFPCHWLVGAPTGMSRTRALQCKSRCNSNNGSIQPPRALQRSKARTGSSLGHSLRPAAPVLCGQDHQACPTSLTCEFGGTFAPSGGEPSPTLLRWWCASCCGLTHPDGEVTPAWCRWPAGLIATKSARLPPHSPSCFSTDLCRCTLQEKTFATQNPCLRTRCSMGVGGVGTTGPGMITNRSCKPCSLEELSTWRTRVGPLESLVRLREAWPHMVPEERVLNKFRSLLMPPSSWAEMVLSLHLVAGVELPPDPPTLGVRALLPPNSVDNASPHGNTVLGRC